MTPNIPWKKLVLKVGSALIAPDGLGCSARHGLAIAQFVLSCREAGCEVVLVSSGSVAAGKAKFPQLQRKRYLTIPEKQALAAVGQVEVLSFWQRFFDFTCAQILLSHDDFKNRRRFLNASNALKQLLKIGALPIINENDSVATEELKVGDNDNLAAQVAVLVQAEALLICSDVDGLFDKNPKNNPDAKLIARVEKINERIRQMASPSAGEYGVGGMHTKLEAAEKATSFGIDTMILNGAKADSFASLLVGKPIGTHFIANTTPLEAKKHWLKHNAETKAALIVDIGAKTALLENGASLLAIGVRGFEGRFAAGDTVAIKTAEQEAIATGIVQFDHDDLIKIKGLPSSEIRQHLGFESNGTVVHRDDMAIL